MKVRATLATDVNKVPPDLANGTWLQGVDWLALKGNAQEYFQGEPEFNRANRIVSRNNIAATPK